MSSSLAELEARLERAASSGQATPATSHALPARRTGTYRVTDATHNRVTNRFAAFANGAADTLSFGFFDEASAWVDSTVPTWLGGTGESYDEALRRNRAIMRDTEERFGGSFLTGQIGGAFVPIIGWASRARGAVTVGAGGAAGASSFMGTLTNAGRMAQVGAVEGALYGYGSSDSEELFSFDRVRDAGIGALYGAAGGFVLGGTVFPAAAWGGRRAMAMFSRGRPPRFDKIEFKPSPAAATRRTVGETAGDVAEARAAAAGRPAPASSVTPTTPTVVTRTLADAAEEGFNDLTGLSDDVVEAGALFSSREVRNGTALTNAFNRIKDLTPQAAARMAKHLEKVELSGELTKDPHYRALLGIDMGEDTDAALRAASVMEDIVEALLEKAGIATKRTTKSLDDEFNRLYGGRITDADVDQAIERTSKGVSDGRIGSHLMAMAGMQFARAKDKYLPEIAKGNADARAALAEVLTNAIRLSAKGRIIAGNLGRALGDMGKSRKLAFTEVKGELVEVEDAKAIAARVRAALKELDDGTLAEVLSRMRSMNDLEEIEDVLLNADRAKELSNWRRSFNSFGLFLKSNALTPMSGVVNIVGMTAHDFFRNTAAKAWAANRYEMAGKATEALKMRFEMQIGHAVYWEAHRQGLQAMMQRIKWEWWDSVEKIAGVADDGVKAALRASTAKRALIADGYRPPALREFDKTARAAVLDTKAFRARMAQKVADGGAFAHLMASMETAGAVTLNAVDALGTATARLISGALDDWGSNFVRVKETYAYTARFAINEALALGLPPQEAAVWAGNRVKDLIELPPSEVLQQVEDKLMARIDLDETDKFLLEVGQRADAEAEATMFMDGPQTAGGRLAARGAQAVDDAVSLPASLTALATSGKVRAEYAEHGWPRLQGILMTYIRTPTRIFERGLVSYTPWGGASDEIAKILKRGGPDAAIEKARMEMGSMVMGIGAMAAMSGAITLTNGGFDNSANLEGAPPNRINLPGGAYVELGRLDPFALTLAMGAFIGQSFKAYQEEGDRYEADEATKAALQIAYLGIREAILEKSYMTGARDLMKAIFSQSEGGGFVDGYQKIITDAFVRLPPFAGTLRQVNDTINGEAPEAISLMDKMLRLVPGYGHRLPPRVDLLGDPIDGRFMGLAAGVKNSDDPVRTQLADLGIDLTALGKSDPKGFKLTSEELSELRRIRGREALDQNGMTMREALADLFADPMFQSLPTKEQQRDMVMEAMQPFNNEARAIFEERNPQYLSDRTAVSAFTEYMAEGYSSRDASALASEDVAAEGLPAPTRLPTQ